jgi:hypothetical protein
MKTRRQSHKMSGVTLIEVITLIAVAIVVSASIQNVSNGRHTPKSLKHHEALTNQLGRELHAPVDAFHAYAPSH